MNDGVVMLVFICTFVSPHTMPFGIALTQYYDQVVFISTMELTEERKKMGYDVTDARITVRNLCDDPQECTELIDNAKDVILACADFHLVLSRIQMGKRVFIAHERLLKKGLVKLLDPRTWRIATFCRSVRNKPVYFLAIGDNAAKDFRFLGFDSQKIYRFGYFPQVSRYKPEQLHKSGDKLRILWVGRFVDFKRPLMALKAFQDMGDGFILTMAGSGPLLSKAEVYAKNHGITVTFLGNISAGEVEKHMLQSHILLSTSHKGEGWGAVINEGMNRGCAVVCAREIGCAGTLATEENAVLFNTYSMRSLRSALREVALRNQELRQKGYDTVTQEFNAEIAAQRFALLAENGISLWETGLCSKVF